MTTERRIMKRNDFSFNEPSIFIEKDALKSMAKIAKKNNKLGHAQCLTSIANIFCGVNNDFSEYWQNGIFDLTLNDAIENHPDIVNERFKAVSEFCGTDFDHIKAVTKTLHYDSIHE